MKENQLYFLSSYQIKDMKTCIGFEAAKITGTKYRKFAAERNFFITKEPNAYWEKLVAQGLADCRPYTKGDGPNPQIYKLSINGAAFLSSLMEIDIDMDRT